MNYNFLYIIYLNYSSFRLSYNFLNTYYFKLHYYMMLHISSYQHIHLIHINQRKHMIIHQLYNISTFLNMVYILIINHRFMVYNFLYMFYSSLYMVIQLDIQFNRLIRFIYLLNIHYKFQHRQIMSILQ